jgi:hypothetical protein
MAEIVGACYGNLRVGAMIVSQTERVTTCRGFAHDLQSNFASTSETVESTVKKDGTPYDERMRAVIAKAALAKARRDATFQVVPKALCRSIEIEARKVAVGDATTIEKRRQNVVTWIERLAIPKERVWAALGVQGESDLGIEELATLVGLKTAIKDGEVAVDEAFPPIGANQDGAPKFVPKAKPEPKPSSPQSEQQKDVPKEAPADDKLPVAPEKTPEATVAAPKAEKPTGEPVALKGWRDLVITVKSPAWSGKRLGDLSLEQIEKLQTEYIGTLDQAKLTLSQKALMGNVALALAELRPSTHHQEEPELLPAADTSHVTGFRKLIEAQGWTPEVFVTVCKINHWLPEEYRKFEQITPEDIGRLEAEWDEVSSEMKKAHQPEQQP